MPNAWYQVSESGDAQLRVALIDSGVAEDHPHVGAVTGGRAFVGDDPSDFVDRLGHGTAVAAAIREKVPYCDLHVARVLDRTLATTARVISEAIVWAVEQRVQIVNVSLGTTNPDHEEVFAAAVRVANDAGCLVVSAFGTEEQRWYPGSMTGVLGVVADPECPRFALGFGRSPLGSRLVASPYPRPIPGVPPGRNLAGASFAVGNATGLLARVLAGETRLKTAADVLDWVASRAH